MKIDDASLSRLMALAQDGDASAYRTVLDACKIWLARYFSRRIVPDAVDDLVQDTLLSLHHKRASYDPARPFLPWLAAIARYRWVDQLRKTYRAREEELTDTFGSDPEDEVVMARISINRLLALLPAGQGRAIRLVKIDGLSIVEAALHSGQSEALVKVNIHRGLKRLAALIESE